jgi:RNA polymerase sigma-70 factor (ECF subfamily)
MPLVEGFVARRRLPSGALDDLKQIVRERLFVAGRIREYSGQGPLSNWLRVVAVRAAVDLGRKRTEILLGDESGTGRVAALPSPGEPELDFVKATYRDAVARALKQSLGELPSAERNVLHLHFIDGLTLDELAALFHVHRATIARRIAASREAVLDQARRLFSQQAAVAPDEVDSLFALVRSRIDLTLSSFLGR